MASVSITKPSAAQRQIDAAIRMVFSGEDALAVHTVAAAANRVVLDLAAKRGVSLDDDLFAKSLRPVYRELFGKDRQHRFPEFVKFIRKELNKPANFLKHADRDAGESLNLDSLHTESLVLRSCVVYAELGFDCTPEMRAFCEWHLAVYPKEDGDEIQTGAGYVHDLSRTHQLEFGDWLLTRYRAESESTS